MCVFQNHYMFMLFVVVCLNVYVCVLRFGTSCTVVCVSMSVCVYSCVSIGDVVHVRLCRMLIVRMRILFDVDAVLF